MSYASGAAMRLPRDSMEALQMDGDDYCISRKFVGNANEHGVDTALD
jgi:hypothetical protein